MRTLLTLLLFVPLVGFGQYWQQQGQDIDGEAIEDYSGVSISLSDDGNTVAIGAPENEELNAQIATFQSEIKKFTTNEYSQKKIGFNDMKLLAENQDVLLLIHPFYQEEAFFDSLLMDE